MIVIILLLLQSYVIRLFQYHHFHIAGLSVPQNVTLSAESSTSIVLTWNVSMAIILFSVHVPSTLKLFYMAQYYYQKKSIFHVGVIRGSAREPSYPSIIAYQMLFSPYHNIPLLLPAVPITQ